MIQLFRIEKETKNSTETINMKKLCLNKHYYDILNIENEYGKS